MAAEEQETTEILDFTVIEAGSPPVNSLLMRPLLTRTRP